MSRGYLLDTNHVGQAVNAASVVRHRIIAHRKRGLKVGTCVPVLCEIEVGVQQVSQPDAYRTNLDRLLHQVSIWPIDLSTAKKYGILYQELRRRGRALSQVDIMLASLALQMDLILVTSDRDFTALPDLQIENWSDR